MALQLEHPSPGQEPAVHPPPAPIGGMRYGGWAQPDRFPIGGMRYGTLPVALPSIAGMRFIWPGPRRRPVGGMRYGPPDRPPVSTES